MPYLTLKTVHVGLVILSLSGFILRGIWMLYFPARLQRHWVRITPHIVDTLLFASGIALAFTLELNPAATPWFAVKLIAIVIYILAGSVALRRGRNKATRSVALIIALSAAAWAAGGALSHQPLPWT